eukprot:1157969-Pelagomonas_calceolata.AAC.11
MTAILGRHASSEHRPLPWPPHLLCSLARHTAQMQDVPIRKLTATTAMHGTPCFLSTPAIALTTSSAPKLCATHKADTDPSPPNNNSPQQPCVARRASAAHPQSPPPPHQHQGCGTPSAYPDGCTQKQPPAGRCRRVVQ